MQQLRHAAFHLWLLQAANVHSLLANVPLVDSVVFQLRKTAGMLGGSAGVCA
jgi:hypothetical protein